MTKINKPAAITRVLLRGSSECVLCKCDLVLSCSLQLWTGEATEPVSDTAVPVFTPIHQFCFSPGNPPFGGGGYLLDKSQSSYALCQNTGLGVD
jgi:hypothetical protein